VSRRRSRDGVSRRTWWIVGVAAFIAIDIVLIGWALGAGQRPASSSAAALPMASFAPAPTARPASASPSVTPTPTPTLDPVVLEPMARRIVPIDASRAWRTSTVGCVGGASIDWTEDGGATWTNWPVGDDVAGVGDIVAFDDASMVGVIASLAGDCRTEYRLSFTGGEFWAAYPGEQPDAPTIDALSGAAIVTSSGASASPCGPISEFAGAGGGAAVLCTSTAVAIAPAGLGSWTPIDTGAAAVAITNQGDGYLVASVRDPACVDGLQFSSIGQDGAMTRGACLAGVGDPTTPVTLGTALNDEIWLWLGDRVGVSTDGGTSWAGLG
jgi:hypothetical protein